jgi:hypothetical protein
VSRQLRQLLLLGALFACALPASALASGQQAARDCIFDGDLDRHYSNAELRDALDALPSDASEYSDCPDVLRAAISGGSDKGGGRGSPGVGNTDPAAEAAAQQQDAEDLAALTSEDAPPPSVRVGDKRVEPGPNGIFDLATAANELPLPLLVALIAVALLALAGGISSLAERFPVLRRAGFLSKLHIPRVPHLRRR